MLTFLLVILVAGLVILAVVTAGANAKKAGGRGKRVPKGTKVTYRGHVDKSRVKERWMTLETLSRTGGGSGLRNAVMEGDKLLDYVLRESGAPGSTMGDRLKSWGSHFSDTNSVWRAHKLRNSLAHDMDFDLVASQAREAMADFKRALKDLGAL